MKNWKIVDKEKTKVPRNAQFDFMKVVAMTFIIVWHINQHVSINGGGGLVIN